MSQIKDGVEVKGASVGVGNRDTGQQWADLQQTLCCPDHDALQPWDIQFQVCQRLPQSHVVLDF